jgi:hypothetical protein
LPKKLGRPESPFSSSEDTPYSRNHLDLNEPELQAIILKHGNAKIHETLRQACADE